VGSRKRSTNRRGGGASGTNQSKSPEEPRFQRRRKVKCHEKASVSISSAGREELVRGQKERSTMEAGEASQFFPRRMDLLKGNWCPDPEKHQNCKEDEVTRWRGVRSSEQNWAWEMLFVNKIVLPAMKEGSERSLAL